MSTDAKSTAAGRDIAGHIAADGAYIIAEIGVNYYDIAKARGISVLDGARLMIDEAHAAGAHAAKFQTYKAGTLASRNSPAYWDQSEEPTTSQFELFSKFDKLGEADYAALAAHCEAVGIDFLSTPFDFESADYLAPLMPYFKVSSSDLTNLPFIEHMAAKGKPMLLSTGAATVGEIDAAVRAVRRHNQAPLVVMHCVLDYPTAHENANLNMIKHLAAIYPDCEIGFSDHTRPDPTMMTITTAVLYGAPVIEKHFTLDKTLTGNDHYHAMDPEDLRRFRGNLALIKAVSGQTQKAPLPCEMAARAQARRSLVATRDLPEGTRLTRDMLTFKRPGTGISPAEIDRVIGRVVRRPLAEDALLTWDDV